MRRSRWRFGAEGLGRRGGLSWVSLSLFPRSCTIYERVRDVDVGLAVGDQGSIGVLVMRKGSAEDRNIPDGPPFDVGVI